MAKVIEKRRAAGTAGAQRGGASGGRALPWAGAVVLLALAAVVAWWWAAGRRPAAEAGASAAPSPLRPNTVRPSSLDEDTARAEPRPPEGEASGQRQEEPRPSEAVAEPAPPEKPKRPLSRKQEELQRNYVYPTPGQARLDSGYIMTFKPPEEGHAVRFFKEGKFYWCYADGTFEAIERKPIFDDPFEEQLVGLATPGATFVPSVLLSHSEEELRKMLSRPVVINEDDSEEVVRKKEDVAEMKKILSDYLQEGGAYSDFIREMHEYSKEERRLRSNGMAKVYDLIDRDDLDGAREFVETYNELLGENNFNPLKLPKKVEARLYGGED